MTGFAAVVATLGLWGWWIVGAALLVVEVLAPGIVFLWLGIAAFATGIVVLLLPLGWELQLVVFAGFAVVSVAGGRTWQRKNLHASDEPSLNRRAEQHVGRVATLNEPIVDGTGRMKLGDSSWKVIGPDLAAGTKVRVVGVEGTALRIEAA